MNAKSVETRPIAHQEIIITAAECFMEQGFNATSIDDVARRLNATKGKIYHYYASKTDLFFDIHRIGMEKLFAAVLPASRATGDGLQVLQAMLFAHAMALLEHYTFESVVVQGVQLHRYGALTPSQRRVVDDLMASRDEFEALFKAQLDAAKADGSAADLNTSIAVKTMLGGLQWSLIWYRPKANETPEDRHNLAEQMVRTLIEGLRAR